MAAAGSPEVQSRVHTVAGVGAQVADGVGMTASQVRALLPNSRAGANLGRTGQSSGGKRHQGRK